MQTAIRRLLSRWHYAAGPGPRGERAAERYLRQHRYKTLARNLRSKLGEIDLLVLTPDRQRVVLVEVKTSENRTTAIKPEHRVGPAKQRKLTALAYKLKQQHKLDGLGIRFDVVGVDLRDGEKPEVRHYENAFDAAW
ncbi:MAG: YraN family protein [Phycisphaerales bacterium JB063]